MPVEVHRATSAVKGQYPCGGTQGYIGWQGSVSLWKSMGLHRLSKEVHRATSAVEGWHHYWVVVGGGIHQLSKASLVSLNEMHLPVGQPRDAADNNAGRG